MGSIMRKKRILVQICCAPDALYVMDLLKENFDVTGYFYNPNIHPDDEYFLRHTETEKVAEITGFPLITGPYDPEIWTQLTRKYKDEPEKGRRCDICYAFRLKKTAEQASILGFDGFTTVMSLSPLKKADTINRIGRMFARRFGIEFLEANFKKKDGFLLSVRMSKDHGIYRQDYCGCEPSYRDKLKRGK